MRYVLTLLVAVGLSLAVSPADARPLHGHGHGEAIALPAPCARIIVTKHGDCTVRICVKRHHSHRHDHPIRKHHRRHCLPPLGFYAR